MPRILYRSLAFLFLLLVSLWVFSFLKNYGKTKLDESKLDEVAPHYYKIIPKSLPGGHIAYQFLCQKSQRDISEDEFRREWTATKTIQILTAQSLTNISVSGVNYGIVSVKYSGRDKQQHKVTECGTSTWLLENGKWRLLITPQTLWTDQLGLEKARDYAAATLNAEKILAYNPFDTSGYRSLYFDMKKSQTLRSHSTGLTTVEIAAKLANINPNDAATIQVADSENTNP
jgi:hypothetical protein